MGKCGKGLIWLVIIVVYFVAVTAVGVGLVLFLRGVAKLDDPAVFTFYGCYMTTMGFELAQIIEDCGTQFNRWLDTVAQRIKRKGHQ